VKNEVGWSGYSPVLTTYAAIVPAQLAAPVTSVDGTSVKVEWGTADDGGVAVTAYKILLKNSGGSWVEELTSCDGSDPTIVTNRYCHIPMTTLTSTLGLVQGTTVQAKVAPINAIGTGTYSNPNSAGALIEVPPLKPASAPSRNSGTSTSQIVVDYVALTAPDNGGSAIVSYELQWDQGTDTWVTLTGFSPYSLLL